MMWLFMRGITCVAAVVLSIFIPQVALSLPPVQVVSDTEGDSTVSLRLLQEAIVGDAVSWCEVRVQVASAEVPWTAGDTVSASVFEDDSTGDDLVWTTSFTVTAAEVGLGLVDRIFDCSGIVDDDGGQPSSEVYAEVRVEKDGCNFFCVADSPRTANAALQWVADDGFEEDDTSNTVVQVLPGLTADRISNDEGDWISFNLADVFSVEAVVVHDPGAGRLDAVLLDATQTPVGIFQPQADATVASETLPAGTYFVVVGPADAGDPNFYDFQLTLSPVAPAVSTLPFWLQGALAMSLVMVALFMSRRGWRQAI